MFLSFLPLSLFFPQPLQLTCKDFYYLRTVAFFVCIFAVLGRLLTCASMHFCDYDVEYETKMCLVMHLSLSLHFICRIGEHHGLSGFPGLIVAGLFGVSLSTISTGSNYVVERLLVRLKKVSVRLKHFTARRGVKKETKLHSSATTGFLRPPRGRLARKRPPPPAGSVNFATTAATFVTAAAAAATASVQHTAAAPANSRSHSDFGGRRRRGGTEGCWRLCRRLRRRLRVSGSSTWPPLPRQVLLRVCTCTYSMTFRMLEATFRNVNGSDPLYWKWQ